MGNFGKSWKIILTGVGLGILGYLVSREYKKSIKRQEQQDEQVREKLTEAGIDPDRYEKELESSEDNSIVKALYMSLDTEVDVDVINIQNCIDNDNVIHLRQFDEDGKDKTLDILFEIPESMSERGNFSVPKIVDYINTFMKKKSELEKQLLQQVRTGLEGYFVVSYINEEGHKIIGTTRIPKEMHLPFASGKNDGLTSYIDHLRSNGMKVDLSRFETVGGTNVEILDVKLLFKLSINRELTDLSTLRNILKDLIDFEVVRPGSNNNVKTVYEYIMFNAYGPAGNWSLLHYYTHEKGNGVVIRDYEY